MKLFIDIILLLPVLLLFNFPLVASSKGLFLDDNEDGLSLRGQRELKGGKKGGGKKGGGKKGGGKKGSGKKGGGKKGGGKKGGGKKGGGGDFSFGDGPSEFYPCIPFSDPGVQDKVQLPNTEDSCRTNSCSGCCRDYNWLVCDEGGQMPFMRCICNQNTVGNIGQASINVGSGGNGNGSNGAGAASTDSSGGNTNTGSFQVFQVSGQARTPITTAPVNSTPANAPTTQPPPVIPTTIDPLMWPPTLQQTSPPTFASTQPPTHPPTQFQYTGPGTIPPTFSQSSSNGNINSHGATGVVIGNDDADACRGGADYWELMVNANVATPCYGHEDCGDLPGTCCLKALCICADANAGECIPEA